MDTTQLEDERHYVYALSYPDGRIFYIGKGQGRRILEHEREAKRGDQSRKCHIIREIWGAGREVLKTKLAFFDTDLEALRYESHLISSIGGLANIVQGRKTIAEILLTPDDMHYFGMSIRRLREDGTEYYDAHEMAEFFGFTKWENFHRVIKKAIKIWRTIETDVSMDLIPVSKLIQTGHNYKTKRVIDNYQLSRAAFLMLIPMIDSTNIVASVGKRYLARRAVEADTKQRRTTSTFDQIEALNRRLNAPVHLMDSDQFVANAFHASLTRQQLEREEQKHIEQRKQPALFPEDAQENHEDS